MPALLVDRMAEVTLIGNGRVIYLGLDGLIHEARLAPNTVSEIVGIASKAVYPLSQTDVIAQGGIGEKPTPIVFFELNTSLGCRSVWVHRLTLELLRGELDPREDEVIRELRGLYILILGRLSPGDPLFRPEEAVVRIYTLRPEVEASVEPRGDWPADLVGRLEGDDVDRALGLLPLGHSGVYLLDNAAHGVTVETTLPELSCPRLSSTPTQAGS